MLFPFHDIHQNTPKRSQHPTTWPNITKHNWTYPNIPKVIKTNPNILPRTSIYPQQIQTSKLDKYVLHAKNPAFKKFLPFHLICTLLGTYIATSHLRLSVYQPISLYLIIRNVYQTVHQEPSRQKNASIYAVYLECMLTYNLVQSAQLQLIKF